MSNPVTKGEEEQAWLRALRDVTQSDVEQIGELESLYRLDLENLQDLVECWRCGIANKRETWLAHGAKCPFCRRATL